MPEPIRTKEDLLTFGAVAVVKKEVTVDGETREICFRELTGEGMALFMDMQGEEVTFRTDQMVQVLAMTLCDANGNRQFTTDEDLEALRQMKWEALNAIFLVAMRVIKLTAEEVETEKKD